MCVDTVSGAAEALEHEDSEGKEERDEGED